MFFHSNGTFEGELVRMKKRCAMHFSARNADHNAKRWSMHHVLCWRTAGWLSAQKKGLLKDCGSQTPGLHRYESRGV